MIKYRDGTQVFLYDLFKNINNHFLITRQIKNVNPFYFLIFA